MIVTYTCDGEFHPTLRRHPAADHEPGEMEEIRHWDGNFIGEIARPRHTYAVVNLMNEQQVTIAETTTGGREELINPDGILHYWVLMRLVLQRAGTAREAVEVMGDLVAEYGYRSTGESFYIGDPHEAWIVEMVGPGPGGEGAHWVALKVPAGYVVRHANLGRIHTFDRDDTDNVIASEGMEEFAAEKGWYDPDSEPLQLARGLPPRRPPETALHRNPRVEPFPPVRPLSGMAQRLPPRRRGRRALPPVDQAREEAVGGRRLRTDARPLRRHRVRHDPGRRRRSLRHAQPLAPHGLGSRRPELHLGAPHLDPANGLLDGHPSRARLPDPVGGLTWYGVDDTYFTCYVPLYCGIDAVPESFATGGLGDFTWDSAWWVFNFVANYANLKYSYMIQDIQAVQSDLEGEFLDLQPAVEKTAVELAKTDPDLCAAT